MTILTIMLKHYLAQFFRNLKRNKLFSLINILGLSAGICTSLLIYLYVDYHTSFDQFHENGQNIYRVNQTFIWSDQVDEQFGSTGPGVMFAMSEALPEVKRATRLLKLNEYLMTYKNELGQQVSFMEPNVLAADSNFLDVFSFPLLKGNSKDLLTNPKHIVLTETASQKYFGAQDPINKMLTVEFAGHSYTYQVAGVLADIPDHSHLTFDMLVPMNSIPRVKAANWSWVWTGFVTFVEMYPNADIDQVEEKLKDIPRRYAEQTLQEVMNMSYDDYLNEGKQWNLYIQPLSDIHMNTNVINRINQPISASIVYAYGLSAAFIILLSCINFTNLTTTQHLKRAKFTGIKKILGSSRWQLSLGYMIESVIYCSISSLVGLLALWYVLPLFSQLTGAPLNFVSLLDTKIFGLFIGLVLGMSLIAGGYPALFLSAFKPLDAMKGKIKTGKESASLRNGLIIIQFTVSIVLISSTLIAFEQLAYTRNKDIGFDKENLVSVSHLEWLEPTQRESLIHEFAQIPGVKATSICTSIPPNLWAGDQFEPVNAPIRSTPLNYTTADERYIPTLGLRLKYGRNFSKEFPDDIHSVIVNEEAIRIIGWDLNEEVIGKKIAYGNNENQFKIIGVVENFHFWDLWSSMDSFALFHLNSGMFDSGRNYAALSFHTDGSEQTTALLDQLMSTWQAFVSNRPFNYQFVDEAFAASFQEQQNFLKVLSLFSSLAILIACLGLIGIIIYAIEQRTKEIGIRKIVGANTWQLAVLLSKQHTKLIITAIGLSIPLTIYMMQQWLQDFEYRIEISASVFVVSGLAILSLTLAISAYHSVKAAMTNPVDVLRDE